MKNLKRTYSIKKHLQNIKPKFFILCGRNNHVSSNMASSNQDQLIYLYANDQILSYNLATDNIEILLDVPQAVSCEYIALNHEICVATESGEVLVLNLGTKDHELVSFCEDGIEKMCWSYDQEVVVFITKVSRKVVVMTCTYEPIQELYLDDQNFGDKEFITIGWGKKETQFHGSEGKQAAKQKPGFVNNIQNVEFDDTINVTWRGDSELFAVSFLGENSRMFKVFNKEGLLQYTSEIHLGLGSCISWKPSGSLIAVPDILPNNSTIALFEKNGLRHREIILPFSFKKEPVKNLSWSADSDILSIETEKDGKSQLYLYTTSNYHWYLKQFLKFECKILKFAWSFEFGEEKTLHILLENGIYLVYRWCHSIIYSNGESLHNEVVVAVIDNEKVLLTYFHKRIRPPPSYCETTKKYDDDCTIGIYINECGFIKYPKDPKDIVNLFTVDSNYEIKIFDVKPNNCESVKMLASYKPSENTANVLFDANQFIWIKDDLIVFYGNFDYDTNSCTVGLIKLVKNDNDTYYEVTNSIDIRGIIGSITDKDASNFIIHLIDGRLYTVNISEEYTLGEPKLYSTLPEFCERIQVLKINLLNNDEFRIISHKYNQKLYIDDEKISSDVTSFFITTNYIVFTQLNCLKFVKIYCDKNEITSTIANERKIECGGRLIVIVPTTSQTILQMPRGNLETICPRILLLDTVGKHLDNLEFYKAMQILRVHRINMNILFDHNPKKFVDNIDAVLDQIEDCNLFNLFLNDLKNEDFTLTSYSDNYTRKNPEYFYPEKYKVDEKIQFICTFLCEKMEKKDFSHFFLSIITSYVKIGNIEKALDIIWTNKKLEVSSKLQHNNSEKALNYLLYLVNVNDLYNVALGMYDFSLVLYVANKSQKDPKEYTLFLNQLKKYEENYRKFKIDEYLKRYERALESLVKCDDKFEECITFVEKHKLYQKALSEFKNLDNKESYKKIALHFADYLRANNQNEEASLMYERGGDLKQAILSAKHVLDWQRCLMLTKNLAEENNLNEDVVKEELRNISISLIPGLQEHNRHEDAFYLLKTFVNDLNKALSCLLEGKCYLKAIFEAKFINSNIIYTQVRQHLLEYVETLRQNICDDENTFLSYMNRLLAVRIKRIQNESDQNYEAGDGNIDECDLLSDVTSINSTINSRGTGKTFRSSKNRRKHERKLLSLKHGNPFEDIALVDALYNHINKITRQQTHVHDTCKALIELDCDNDAKLLQKLLRDLLLLIKDSLDKIWIPEMMTAQQLQIDPSTQYTQIKNEQRYALLSPQKRIKPQLDMINWEFNILK